MKRTVSIVVSMMCVATALLFTACHSNSNDSNANTTLEQLQINDPIVGDWILNSRRSVQYVDGVVVSDESESDLNSKYSNLKQYEFNSDGSYTCFTANGTRLYGEWSLMDDGYYSLDAEQSDYFRHRFEDYFGQRAEDVYTEFAPATHIARLIDNQTLEMQEMIHFLFTTDEGEGKLEFEDIYLLERIK